MVGEALLVRGRYHRAFAVWCLLAWAILADYVSAHDPDTPPVTLPEIGVVTERPVSASSQRFILDQEYLLQPQGRPAQVLRLIPGMLSVEHSGGAGKADQYFLRGFDADHGTDVAFFVDDMPVNLRSHGHGQGYSDLNFIIPETIERVDVHKGAYDARFGDFATAGAVVFRTRELVREGMIQLAGGQFNTQRHVLMLSPTTGRVRSLFAAEGHYTDGPFQFDNRYFRSNLLAKVTTNPTRRSELSVTGTFHKGQWNGSGEIPLRAVTSGILDRFGAIDPTEGGKTMRATGRMSYHYDTTAGGQFFAHAWGQYYRLDLYSNFTFFLHDPVHGDGIVQSDRRVLYGGEVGFRQPGRLLTVDSVATIGVQSRADRVHVGLARQVFRHPIGSVTESDVFEASYSPYAALELRTSGWLRLSGGMRGEMFAFDVRNRCELCAERPSGRTTSSLVLPKATMILGPWFTTELFVNYGEGFHSNDARAAVVPGASPLARAKTYEVGLRSRPWGGDGLEWTVACWQVDLQSELVFLGDQGTTEIRGASRRRGVEVAARGQVMGPLFLNGSVAWTSPKFRTGEAIPLAPELVGYGALILHWPPGLTTQVQGTYMGVRPLVEDRRVQAPSWFEVDLSMRYAFPVERGQGRLETFLFIQNLLDTKWEQAAFAFESRLKNEPVPVADMHFVPGTPRMLLGGMAWSW
jgi:outer membrane receptor protein involved in Fe transport